jgi:hypothetical protein
MFVWTISRGAREYWRIWKSLLREKPRPNRATMTSYEDLIAFRGRYASGMKALLGE